MILLRDICCPACSSMVYPLLCLVCTPIFSLAYVVSWRRYFLYNHWPSISFVDVKLCNICVGFFLNVHIVERSPTCFGVVFIPLIHCAVHVCRNSCTTIGLNVQVCGATCIRTEMRSLLPSHIMGCVMLYLPCVLYQSLVCTISVPQ